MRIEGRSDEDDPFPLDEAWCLHVTHSGYRRARNVLTAFFAAATLVFAVQVVRNSDNGSVVGLLGLAGITVACFVLFPEPWAELTPTTLRRGSRLFPTTETPLAEIAEVRPNRYGATTIVTTEWQRGFTLPALNRQLDLFGHDPRVIEFERRLNQRIARH